MMPVYAKLLASAADLQILVYSGDDDSVCATRGTQQWIWDMGLPLKGEPWRAWTVDAGPDCVHRGPACTQVGGFVTEWEGLTFATVHGAGHMVPATRPMFALEVLKHFLDGAW